MKRDVVLKVRFLAAAVGVYAVMAVPQTWAQTAQGSGLTVGEQTVFGPRLQARVGINSSHAADGASAAWHQQAGVLLGDYYFSRTRLGSGSVNSGFRATSGVLLGHRSLALSTPALPGGQGLTVLRQPRLAMPGIEAAMEPWSAVPYIGIGWSGVSARGGWGVSADFGFAGRGSSGGLRLNGNPGLDDLLRELRLAPMLQLGVSYAF